MLNNYFNKAKVGEIVKGKNKRTIKTILIAECLILAVLLVLLCVPRTEKPNGASESVSLKTNGEHEPGSVEKNEGAGSLIPEHESNAQGNESVKEEQAGKTPDESELQGSAENPGGETEQEITENPETVPADGAESTEQEALAQQDAMERLKETADRLAAMYDYDAAMALIQSYDGYENETVLTDAFLTYESQKAACKPWADNTKISHVFFHSLIADTSLALGPNSGTRDGYNRYMTTIEEFEKIIQQMYDRGYVLVGIHDISEIVVQEDGTEKMVMKKILLPEGKIPFVMSQDDVNYYDYMDGEGFATKIVIGEDGKPTCEYIQKDGTVVTGDYDLVPVLDRFVEAHPDFSYRGAKAILAITGYEGTLGYETAPYRYDEVKHLAALSSDEKKIMLEAEKEACKEVVDALKADGYEFASHSYGHGNMQTNSVEKFKYDMNRWLDEVGSLLGDTDVFIYPFGADICDWRGYHGEKYEYAIANGFRYFCNVDSAQYWVQMKNDYLRQGRINLDGERMMKDPDKLSCFFDVESVLDPTRPPLEE